MILGDAWNIVEEFRHVAQLFCLYANLVAGAGSKLCEARDLFHEFSAAFPQARPGVTWHWFGRDAGGLPLPSSVLDPHREIELQAPRAFAIQGFDDRLMRAKTPGIAIAGELSRPLARLSFRGRRRQVRPQDIHVPRRAKQTRQPLQFVAKPSICNIEDHGFKKRHGRSKASNRDSSLVNCLDIVGLLQPRKIQMKVVQTGLSRMGALGSALTARTRTSRRGASSRRSIRRAFIRSPRCPLM